MEGGCGADGVALAVTVTRVREILRAATMTDAYRVALTAALALPGNILHDVADARWARLVWVCCVAAGGRREDAAPAAAAAEIFMTALDVLDDEEDGEVTPLRASLGAARMLNVSTGLLLLAQHGLLATPKGAVLTDILLVAGVGACAGQHNDLRAGQDDDGDLDAALAVAAGKSGSLAAALCRLGAACAEADADTQDRYARFGTTLGTMRQLRNDIAAVQPGATGKTDITLRRPTLPLVSAAHMGAISGAHVTEADMRAILWADGAALLTWTVAETYRRYALDLVPTLTANPDSRAALALLLEQH